MSVQHADHPRTRHGVNYRTAGASTHQRSQSQSHRQYGYRRQRSSRSRLLLPVCYVDIRPRQARRRRALRGSHLDVLAGLVALVVVSRRRDRDHERTSRDNPDGTQHRIRR